MARGLEIASNLGIYNIWVEMDSMVGLSVIQSKNAGHWQLQHLLAKIKTFTGSMNIKFSHIYREGNTVADFFANMAIREQVSKILNPVQTERQARGLILLDRLAVPNFWTR